MELRDVRGMGRETEEKLAAAGVTTAAELAWVDDLHALAGSTGISVSHLAGLRLEAARASHRPLPPRQRLLRQMSAWMSGFFARSLATMKVQARSR